MQFQRTRGRVWPGVAVGGYRDGELVDHRTIGLADLARREPTTVDTVFDVASVSK